MAAADVLPLSSKLGSIKRKRSESISSPSLENNMSFTIPRKFAFDPDQHLAFQEPDRIWTMEEIGHADVGVSPIAVSNPFPLFTKEAIMQMRDEILSDAVQQNCKYQSNLAASQLRGFAPKYAPFVYDAWNNPEVLSIVSKIAGIELVPQMDLEIAHINLNQISAEQKEEDLKAMQEKQHRDADEGVSGCPWEDDKPIVDWHTDSYPFVCVTMLSDCTNMIGGETALLKGDGDIMKVRGPQMGHAVVLQGRYIEHQALRTLGTTERITMVTSFRPKSAFIKDDTVLTTVRSISNLSDLYSQYAEYRLDMLEERVRAHRKELNDRKRAGRNFNTAATKAFITEQKDFLESMLREMVDDDKVVKGHTEQSHLRSGLIKMNQHKKARL
ncbi:uncharacterized protein A1O9_10240 [Exophiala aquamarina CBS 119918]|uniref:Fe2OG dioxygenase domain-containing protein n=1 Tax=Exophiala aquamarina CBS 119918 TaxID=1182545 RepID=A0A072P3K4_9EURO|nr:uncharacterized protein A1O9_10240 [Exophiala aquamarina CBS 119918]KEF53838.1 hypothetical protein A1O9_10240 [Exophiala aquamarina CBS 119918]